MATEAESKRLDQMTNKQLVKEYDRCLRASRRFCGFNPGSSAESNRQRNELHHRIAEIIRRLSWPQSDPHSAIYFRPRYQAIIVAVRTLFDPWYWALIVAAFIFAAIAILG